MTWPLKQVDVMRTKGRGGVGITMGKFTGDLIKRGKQMSNSYLGLDLSKCVIKSHSEDN